MIVTTPNDFEPRPYQERFMHCFDLGGVVDLLGAGGFVFQI